MARIERVAYRLVTPRDFDTLSFREMMAVMRAASDVERNEVRSAAIVATYVFNHGGMRPKNFRLRQPQELFPSLFGGRTRGEIVLDKIAAALEQEARYLAEHERAEQRRQREVQ